MKGVVNMKKDITDYVVNGDREINVLLDENEDVSFKELIKSLGMTQKQFSETFKIPIGTLRHWIAGERECPAYTKRMLMYMVALKKIEKKSKDID